MALITSARVNVGATTTVTIVVNDNLPPSADDTIVDLTMEIDTDHAMFMNTPPPAHSADFTPQVPNSFITWEDVPVPHGDHAQKVAVIQKDPNSDSTSTTVLCVVSGTYRGNPHFDSCPAVVYWP